MVENAEMTEISSSAFRIRHSAFGIIENVPWRRKVPGGAAGLQNQSGGRKVPGGFDSLPSPPLTADSGGQSGIWWAPISAQGASVARLWTIVRGRINHSLGRCRGATGRGHKGTRLGHRPLPITEAHFAAVAHLSLRGAAETLGVSRSVVHCHETPSNHAPMRRRIPREFHQQSRSRRCHGIRSSDVARSRPSAAGAEIEPHPGQRRGADNRARGAALRKLTRTHGNQRFGVRVAAGANRAG
jgi:hypothetical protein